MLCLKHTLKHILLSSCQCVCKDVEGAELYFVLCDTLYVRSEQDAKVACDAKAIILESTLNHFLLFLHYV